MICDFGRVKGVFRTGPWLHDTWWKPYKVIVHKGGIEDEQVSTSIENTVCSCLFLCVFKSSSIIQKHVQERHMRNTSWFWHCDFQQNIYSHIMIINAAFQFHEVHIFKKRPGGRTVSAWPPESASEDETTVAERMRSKKGGRSIEMTCLALKVMFFFVKFHPKFQVLKIGGTELNLIRLFLGVGFSTYVSLTYSLYRWIPPF